MPRSLRCIVLLLCLLASTMARAQLTIEIVGGGAAMIPIAIVPFANEGTFPLSVTQIVANDLARSGLFKLVDAGGVTPRPARAEDVRYGDWTARGADAVVVGSMTPLPDGRFEVRFRLLDVPKQIAIGGIAYTLTAAQVRLTAHKIADFIYEKLTGERGVFSTRIAYVVKQGARFELRVADADGQNAAVDPDLARSRSCRPPGRPTGCAWPTSRSRTRSPILFVQNPRRASSPRRWRTTGGRTARPPGRPTARRLAAVLTRRTAIRRYTS